MASWAAVSQTRDSGKKNKWFTSCSNFLTAIKHHMAMLRCTRNATCFADFLIVQYSMWRLHFWTVHTKKFKSSRIMQTLTVSKSSFV